jgi:hypothetical protein
MGCRLMIQRQWDKLSEGDLIRHTTSSRIYTVMANHQRGGVVLADVALASNPCEWDLVAEAYYQTADQQEDE